ncbi:TIGR04222 domain-containing membrane protein [Nocardiopsis sp. YSL2]|uniref:TIGR04222 domain-containing membrane protein n=1 Tax=Nocardiopsis sp. YSL2 TaxID=2939492 RepID=UPI0026F42DB3|nr:TIGR04222 domain-containing membrane protein [Nocardiopsis sp. YSL2]
MDGSTLVSLVIAVVVGLVVGVIPLQTVIRSRAALNNAVKRTPSVSPPDADDLKPEELAYLAGGPVRVAETIIMDLYLSGRIRHQAPRGFFTLVGPVTPYVHEKSLIRRTIVLAYRDRSGLTAQEMIRRATTSGGMIALADGLKASRLRADSLGLSRLLASREKVPSRITWMRTLSLLVGIVAGGFYFVEPGTVSLGLLVGGFFASAMLSVDKAVLDSTGGATLLTTTPAGRAVLARAEERYKVVAQSTKELDRDLAVRYTAVTGFRALREAVPGAYRSSSASRHTSAAPGPSGGIGDTGVVEPSNDDAVHLESLCGFAEVCQGGTGGSGTSSGGDGWGGMFTGGGNSSSTHDSGSTGGGGWSFGGGDSGSSGGDGGGGGGGD